MILQQPNMQADIHLDIYIGRLLLADRVSPEEAGEWKNILILLRT